MKKKKTVGAKETIGEICTRVERDLEELYKRGMQNLVTELLTPHWQIFPKTSTTPKDEFKITPPPRS